MKQVRVRRKKTSTENATERPGFGESQLRRDGCRVYREGANQRALRRRNLEALTCPSDGFQIDIHTTDDDDDDDDDGHDGVSLGDVEGREEREGKQRQRTTGITVTVIVVVIVVAFRWG